MKCKSCGAEIEFNVKTQKLKCEYCYSEFDPKEYEEVEKVAKEQPENEYEAKSFSCKQCGAKLLAFDDTAITFCSYCESSMVIESELYKGEMPEYVIPFKITKEECEEIYKKEIKKHFFAPKEMKEDIVIKKFRGIYMPYAVYKAVKHGNQKNHGEVYSHRSGNYDYYDKYEITSNIDAEYEGMAFDLSSNFYDKFSQGVAPFNFKEAEKFNIKYLSGFYADSKNVNKELYQEEAKEIIEPDASNELAKHKEFRKYGCSSPDVSFNIKDTKIAYYPVYFLAVRNKKNDAVNCAVINGQTGKIAVELPIDLKKYIIFSLMISVIVFVLLNLFLTVTPHILLVIAIFLAFINIIIIGVQRGKIKVQQNYEDDKGYVEATKENKTKETKKEKRKSFILSVIGLIFGIIICIATLTLDPVFDTYYYVSAITSLLLTLLSFKKIIVQYNELTSRKLSQIGIRGGDESEI